MTVVTLVLASGRGTRLGGPKALLAWAHDGDTMPLALAHVRARLSAESDRALVVTREDIARTLTAHGSGADVVISRAPDEQGAAGSIAAALASMVDAADDTLVLLTPVDCPPASAQTVALLLARLRDDDRLLAARPRFGMRGGHPVAARLAALQPYRDGSPPPLRDRLRDLGNAVADVQVDDERIVADIDTEQDYARWSDAPLSFMAAPE